MGEAARAGRPSTLSLELWERRNTHFGVRLSVATLLEISTFLSVANDVYLLRASIFDEFTSHLRSGDVGGADRGRCAVVREQNFIKSDFIARILGILQLLNRKHRVLCDNILFSASLNDCYLGHICGRSLRHSAC